MTMAEKEYIDREALIKVCKKIIQDRWGECTAPVSWANAYADFIDDIEAQPAADVTPVKHGYWTDKTHWLSRLGICRYQCSVCGKYIGYKPDTAGNDDMAKDNYCKNCGAKMDE